MRLFYNDNLGSTFDESILDKEELFEYTVNEWIKLKDGREVYFVSLYIYDDFVMILYMYDLSYHPEYTENYEYTMAATHREQIKQSEKINSGFILDFDYEVNYLKELRKHYSTHMPKRPSDEDKGYEIAFEEYDYIYNIMKENNRIPKELLGKDLVFGKTSCTFESPVERIHQFAIYPQLFKYKNHYIWKDITIPYGDCNIKVHYTTTDNEEGYVIIKELKAINLMDSYTEQYNNLIDKYETYLIEFKKSEQGQEQPLGIEEIKAQLEANKEMYNKTMLTLTIQKEEKERSFSFHTSNYLDEKVTENSYSSSIMIFHNSETDDTIFDDMGNQLHTSILSLGELKGKIMDEYDITLIMVTDMLEPERKAYIEKRE